MEYKKWGFCVLALSLFVAADVHARVKVPVGVEINHPDIALIYDYASYHAYLVSESAGAEVFEAYESVVEAYERRSGVGYGGSLEWRGKFLEDANVLDRETAHLETAKKLRIWAGEDTQQGGIFDDMSMRLPLSTDQEFSGDAPGSADGKAQPGSGDTSARYDDYAERVAGLFKQALNELGEEAKKTALEYVISFILDELGMPHRGPRPKSLRRECACEKPLLLEGKVVIAIPFYRLADSAWAVDTENAGRVCRLDKDDLRWDIKDAVVAVLMLDAAAADESRFEIVWVDICTPPDRGLKASGNRKRHREVFGQKVFQASLVG